MDSKDLDDGVNVMSGQVSYQYLLPSCAYEHNKHNIQRWVRRMYT